MKRKVRNADLHREPGRWERAKKALWKMVLELRTKKHDGVVEERCPRGCPGCTRSLRGYDGISRYRDRVSAPAQIALPVIGRKPRFAS